MMHLKFIQTILISSLLLISFKTYGQLGTFEGKVIDKNTKEILTGAKIILVGTKYSAISDFEGHFTFTNLKTGNYKLQINFISYKSIVLNDIKIEAVSNTELIVLMDSVGVNMTREKEVLSSKQLITQNIDQNSI
jgi:hypothetical protein